MKTKTIVLLLFVAVFVNGCGKKTPTSFTVDKFSNGKAGEVIVVMDDHYFNDQQKKQVYDELQQPQPAINQIEPMFDILKFQPADFTSEFVRHRNILHFDVNVNYSSNLITYEKNAWSSPQVYVKIKGNNVDSCLKIFNDNADSIVKEMYDNDLRRLQNYYNKDANPEITKLLKSKFGIVLSVPSNYFVAREEEDFVWLRFRTPKNDRFIMIYKTPAYELTEKNLIDARNRMTKDYVPGAVKNAYPKVADIEGLPIVSPVVIGNRKGIEMRGLWDSHRDKMGGPFYSFTFVAPNTTESVTIDGFVYAPQENKRDYLREVEAIVKTLR